MNTPPQVTPLPQEAPPPRQRRLPAGAKAVTAAVASAAIAFTGLPAVQADTALPAVGSGFKFDFGPGALADGYTAVGAGTQYSSGTKFGFTDTAVTSGVDRGTGDPRRSDFVQAQGSSFLVDLPNGDYTVKLIAGDAAEATNIAITAEKMAKVQATDKPAGQYLEMEFPISLVDGQLNLDFTGTAAKIKLPGGHGPRSPDRYDRSRRLSRRRLHRADLRSRFCAPGRVGPNDRPVL
ncbi:hypothetical protein QFZ70_003664 [Arthrobacter sp. V1I9]|nr:hypothetical protein [Arthrobacter sp. V1I9]